MNLGWYEQNNIPYIEVTKYSKLLQKEYTVKEYQPNYSCGRIDIHGVPNEPFGLEYGVEPMSDKSWGLLGEWLCGLTLDYLPTDTELYTMFEEQTGHKIEWHTPQNESCTA